MSLKRVLGTVTVLSMCCASAFAQQPQTFEAAARRGSDVFHQGKYAEAVPLLDEAARLCPADNHIGLGSIHFLRGFSYQQIKRPAHAVADYQIALRYMPSSDMNEVAQRRLAENGLAQCLEAVRQSGTPPTVLSVKLDEEMKSKVVKKSQPIKLAANSDKTVEDTIRVQHSVTLTKGTTIEADIRGKITAWFAEVQAGVRASIEEAASRTYGSESERRRSVTLRGTATGPAVRVVWVEYFRTGVARVKIDGVELDLPFEFRDDFDLLSEEVK